MSDVVVVLEVEVGDHVRRDPVEREGRLSGQEESTGRHFLARQIDDRFNLSAASNPVANDDIGQAVQLHIRWTEELKVLIGVVAGLIDTNLVEGHAGGNRNTPFRVLVAERTAVARISGGDATFVNMALFTSVAEQSVALAIRVVGREDAASAFAGIVRATYAVVAVAVSSALIAGVRIFVAERTRFAGVTAGDASFDGVASFAAVAE